MPATMKKHLCLALFSFDYLDFAVMALASKYRVSRDEVKIWSKWLSPGVPMDGESPFALAGGGDPPLFSTAIEIRNGVNGVQNTIFLTWR